MKEVPVKRFPRALVALTLVSLLVPTLAFALPVRFGFSAGASRANLPGAKAAHIGFEDFVSFTAGVDVRLPLEGAFELQSGAGYVVKGVSYGGGSLVDANGVVLGSFETLLASDQVEVPLLVRWSPAPHLLFRPYLLAGTFASVQLSQVLKTTGSRPASSDSKVLKSSDFGFVGGAGVATEFGPGDISLTLRYDGGLTNLGTVGTGKVRSGLFALTLGYEF